MSNITDMSTGFAIINGITEVFGRIVFSQILTRIPFIALFCYTIPIGYWGIWITTIFQTANRLDRFVGFENCVRLFFYT